MNNRKTLAERAVANTLNEVRDTDAYLNRAVDSAAPKISRLAYAMETELQRAGGKLVQSSDPENPLRERRALPRKGWPCSIWRCPDQSIAVVFETHAETADNESQLIRYTPEAIPEGTNDRVRYAGQWNGKLASDLANSLQFAAARLTDNSGNQDLDQMMALNLLEIPFWDRIPVDHPFHRLGFLHGIDEQGDAVLSSDSVGTLFVSPTDVARLSQAQALNKKALDSLGDDPIEQMFAPYHEARDQFYRNAIALMTPYLEQQQGAESEHGDNQPQRPNSSPSM